MPDVADLSLGLQERIKWQLGHRGLQYCDIEVTNLSVGLQERLA